MTLVRGARIFDGERMHPPTSVLVRDRVIQYVGDVAPPPGCEVVDGSGQTLLPGLIDAHTHAFPGRLEQALALGVTTEIDMFADPAVAADLRRQARDRADLADLRSAGTGATAPGGHPTGMVERGVVAAFPTLTRPDEAAAFVADRLAEGSDHLKIFVEPGRSLGIETPSLDAATVAALVDAAHGHGLLAIAHVTDVAAARVAVGAGVDGLAHIPVDAVLPPDLVAAIAAAGVVVIPTLTVVDGMWGAGEAAQALAARDDVVPHLDGLSRTTLGMRVGRGGEGPAVAAASVGALHAAGVRLLAGTDASNPGTAHGASVHEELRLLVAAGLGPAAALVAATSGPADVFGLADRGRIAPGLVADLVLVAGDPLADLAATTAITGVWRGGVRFDRAAWAAGIASAGGGAASGRGGRLDPLAGTARWMAAERATESARPDALFHDPLAAVLAGDEGRATAERTGGDGGTAIAVRTRFFDDALPGLVAQGGQVVLLAAGMDSRAFRLDLPADVTWFEVDRPQLLALKDHVLAAAGAAPRCDRREVPADLTADWERPLRAAGFDPARPAVWLVEGLLAYLDAAAVDRLLDDVTALSVPGSALLCDPVGRSLLDSPWMRPWLDRLAAAGTPWRFGTDRPEDLLEPRGWRAEVTLMADAAAELGRWPFPRAPRGTPRFPQSFLVVARR